MEQARLAKKTCTIKNRGEAVLEKEKGEGRFGSVGFSNLRRGGVVVCLVTHLGGGCKFA